MDWPTLKRKLVPALCLAASAIISYWSVDFGMGRAFAGKEALVWLHALAFIVAIGLVIAAIVVNARYKK